MKLGLERFELNEKETKVYLKLLELDEALASEISEETNLNRSLIYFILNRLIKKGLVSVIIKNKIKYFRSSSPYRLLEILKEKESNIRKLIPQLLKLHKKKQLKPRVEFYEGKEGIKTILNDIIKTKKEWIVIGGAGKGPVVLSYYAERFQKLRVKAKIKLKAIMNNDKFGLLRGKELSKYSLTEIKYAPKQHKNLVNIYIYGDKTALIMYSEEFPFAILIKDKYTSDGFKEIFNWLWETM